MPKLRVYQLARELNRDNSEIIRELQHMGVPVTSHSNTVEDRLADQFRKKLGVYDPSSKSAAVHEPDDDIVEAIETAEPEIAETPHVEVAKPEPPRVEAKAEPKVEPKPEPPRVEAKVEPKIESKPAPVEQAKVTTPPPPAPPV